MILETPRLLLRDFSLSDAPALNAIERDPRVTRYMSFDPPSLDDSRTYLENSVRLQSETPRLTYDLAIILRADLSPPPAHAGTLIGRCGIAIRRPVHHESELWYLLDPAFRARGYAHEATSALLDFAFRSLKLHRVFADCDPRNTPACRLATQLGMTLEGTLRENYFLKGEWCSSNIYAILAPQWTSRHNDNTPRA